MVLGSTFWNFGDLTSKVSYEGNKAISKERLTPLDIKLFSTCSTIPLPGQNLAFIQNPVFPTPWPPYVGYFQSTWLRRLLSSSPHPKNKPASTANRWKSNHVGCMTDRRRERDMKTVIEAGMSSNIIQPGHLPAKHAAKGIQQCPPSPLHPLIYQVFPLKAPLCLCPQLKSGFPLKKNWPSKEMFPLKEVPSPRLFSTYIRYFALWNKVLKNYCPYNMFPPTIMFPHWIFFHQEWICGSLKKNASPRTCCAKRNCPLSLVP